jgi:16S rRNA A1518/A1519 N6-dimethyltransferase RsmA/KsgA/DIM1 with predicted DNA glycosylase/AP lyase activity
VRALVRAAFASRRKTLVNSLAAAGADKAVVAAALADLGEPPSARPEAIPPAGFAALAEALGWPA